MQSKFHTIAYLEPEDRPGVYVKLRGLDAEAQLAANRLLDSIFSNLSRPLSTEERQEALRRHAHLNRSEATVVGGDEDARPNDPRTNARYYLNHRGRYCGYLSEQRKVQLHRERGIR